MQVIAPAALFLAAKVEEQPRKLEHVIKVTHACLNPQDPSPDTKSDVSNDSVYVRWPSKHWNIKFISQAAEPQHQP